MAMADYCLKERKKDSKPGEEVFSKYKSMLDESIDLNLQELEDHHPDDYMDEEEDSQEAPEEEEETAPEYTEKIQED